MTASDLVLRCSLCSFTFSWALSRELAIASFQLNFCLVIRLMALLMSQLLRNFSTTITTRCSAGSSLDHSGSQSCRQPYLWVNRDE